MASTYYDRLMLQYYQVLNNAWKRKVKDATLIAIKMLSDSSDHDNFVKSDVDMMMDVIKIELGDSLAAEVTKETKVFMETCVKFGVGDVQKELPVGVKIGLWGRKDQLLASKMQKQQLFWIGNHFDSEISEKFSESLYKAISSGFTKDMLVNELKTQFSHLGKKGDYYWQGLAEHTALRIREFGRLNGYEKAGAKGYRLINPMDGRTSDICRALVSQEKIYPLANALQVRDELMAIEMTPGNLDKAKAQIKAMAPWVKEKDIIRNEKGDPTGVQGAHTPFPPFHFK